MRLLNVDTLGFTDFAGDQIPPYAIASHRWHGIEPTLEDIIAGTNTDLAGYHKVKEFCNFTRQWDDQIKWIWIDTCCVDKKSSAELSEVINSMFEWYANAEICFAYLFDVRPGYQERRSAIADLQRSVWFKRGWTLQELLAPQTVVFLDRGWNVLGHKGPFPSHPTPHNLNEYVSVTARIPEDVLRDYDCSKELTAEERVGWVLNRVTTRIEDRAYCLLGIFSIHMPLIYGEGRNAFFRLTEEIEKRAHLDDTVEALRLSLITSEYASTLHDESLRRHHSRTQSLPGSLGVLSTLHGYQRRSSMSSSRSRMVDEKPARPNTTRPASATGIGRASKKPMNIAGDLDSRVLPDTANSGSSRNFARKLRDAIKRIKQRPENQGSQQRSRDATFDRSSIPNPAGSGEQRSPSRTQTGHDSVMQILLNTLDLDVPQARSDAPSGGLRQEPAKMSPMRTRSASTSTPSRVKSPTYPPVSGAILRYRARTEAEVPSKEIPTRTSSTSPMRVKSPRASSSTTPHPRSKSDAKQSNKSATQVLIPDNGRYFSTRAQDVKLPPALSASIKRWQQLHRRWQQLRIAWLDLLDDNADDIKLQDPKASRFRGDLSGVFATGNFLFDAIIMLQRTPLVDKAAEQEWENYSSHCEARVSDEISGFEDFLRKHLDILPDYKALDRQKSLIWTAVARLFHNMVSLQQLCTEPDIKIRGTSADEPKKGTEADLRNELIEARRELAIRRDEAKRAWAEAERLNKLLTQRPGGVSRAR